MVKSANPEKLKPEQYAPHIDELQEDLKLSPEIKDDPEADGLRGEVASLVQDLGALKDRIDAVDIASTNTSVRKEVKSIGRALDDLSTKVKNIKVKIAATVAAKAAAPASPATSTPTPISPTPHTPVPVGPEAGPAAPDTTPKSRIVGDNFFLIQDAVEHSLKAGDSVMYTVKGSTTPQKATISSIENGKLELTYGRGKKVLLQSEEALARVSIEVTPSTEFTFAETKMKPGDTWYCQPRKQSPPKDLDAFPVTLLSQGINAEGNATITLADASGNQLVFTEDEWKSYLNSGLMAATPEVVPAARPVEAPKAPSQEINTQTQGFEFRLAGRKFRVGQDVLWVREGTPSSGPKGPRAGKPLTDKGKIDRFIRDASGKQKIIFRQNNGTEITIDESRIAEIQYTPNSGIIFRKGETFTVSGKEFAIGDHVKAKVLDVSGASKEIKGTIHCFSPVEAKPLELRADDGTFYSFSIAESNTVQIDTEYRPNPYEGFDKEPVSGKQYTYDTKIAGHEISIIEVKEADPAQPETIPFVDLATGIVHFLKKEDWNTTIAPHLREKTPADEVLLQDIIDAKKTKPAEKDTSHDDEKRAKKEAKKRELNLENLFEILGAEKMQPIIANCARLAFETDPHEQEAIESEINTSAKNIFDDLDSKDMERLESMLRKCGYKRDGSTESAFEKFLDGWKSIKHLQLVEVMKEYTNIEMQRLRMLESSALSRFDKELREVREVSRGFIADITHKHLGTVVIPGLVAIGSVAIAATGGVVLPALIGGMSATAVRRHYQRELWHEDQTGKEVAGMASGLKKFWGKAKSMFGVEPSSDRDAIPDMTVERKKIMQDMETRIMDHMSRVQDEKVYDFMGGVLKVLIEERNIIPDPAQIHEQALDLVVKSQKKHDEHHAHGHDAHAAHGHGGGHGAGHGHDAGPARPGDDDYGKEKEPESPELLTRKADRALFLMRQRNPATRSYTDDMRSASNNSDFFGRGWQALTEAIEGATRTKWGLYSESTSKYLAGTFVAGAINGAIGAAILTVGAGSFAAKALARGVWGFTGKGIEGSLMTRGDLMREKEQALHEAFVLLQHPSDNNLRRAEKLIKYAKAETEIGDLIKTSLKRGAVKGTKAAAFAIGAGAAFDEARHHIQGWIADAQAATETPKQNQDLVSTHHEAVSAVVAAALETPPSDHPLFDENGILRHAGGEYHLVHSDPTVKIPPMQEFDEKGHLLLGTTEMGERQGAVWGALTRLGKSYGNFGMSDHEFADWRESILESKGFVKTPDGWASPINVYPSMKIEMFAGEDGRPDVNFIGKEGVDFHTYDHLHVQKAEESIVKITKAAEPAAMGNNLERNAEHLRDLKGPTIHATDVEPHFKVGPDTSVALEAAPKGLPEGAVSIQHGDYGHAYLARDAGHSYIYVQKTDGTTLRTTFEKFFAALPSQTHHAGGAVPLADTDMQHEFAGLRNEVLEAQHDYAKDLGEKAVEPVATTKEYTLTNPYVKKWADTGIPVDQSKVQTFAESNFHESVPVQSFVSVPEDAPLCEVPAPETSEVVEVAVPIEHTTAQGELVSEFPNTTERDISVLERLKLTFDIAAEKNSMSEDSEKALLDYLHAKIDGVEQSITRGGGHITLLGNHLEVDKAAFESVQRSFEEQFPEANLLFESISEKLDGTVGADEVIIMGSNTPSHALRAIMDGQEHYIFDKDWYFQQRDDQIFLSRDGKDFQLGEFQKGESGLEFRPAASDQI